MKQEDLKDTNMENQQEELNNQVEEQLEGNVQPETASIDHDSEALTVEEQLQIELAESKDKYIRLYSEFDNFRKRTAKERQEWIKNATEDLIRELLPVLDDFARANRSFEDEKIDKKTAAEGVNLVAAKLSKVLESKGLQLMEAGAGSDFDADLHEAITKIPAPDESLKGKVVDVVEKGYYLNEKVIRFAKVVIGE
jgi:molecular chaperone GrpE